MFGTGDIGSDFPIYSIQSEVGYNTDTSTGIYSFGDLDAQIVWYDHDVNADTRGLTAYFNGSLNLTSVELEYDPDVEHRQSKDAVIVGGERTIFFDLDDGTSDVDVFISGTKNATSVTQIDTGINMRNVSNINQLIAATVDTKGGDGDDVWLFGADVTDHDDIYYTISTDGGYSWTPKNTMG